MIVKGEGKGSKEVKCWYLVPFEEKGSKEVESGHHLSEVIIF